MKKLLFLISIFLVSVGFIYADELESDNYKIIDANTNSGGEVTNSTNYNLLNTIGDFSGDPRIFSTNYRVGLGAVEVFTANVPEIVCFETDTDGSSSCTTGPTYLNDYGMIRVCGNDGCYDRARFEIQTNNNPADTLYGIQISEDNFSSDVRYIDGTTKKPKDIADRTISDYLSQSAWETPVFNLAGLDSSTTYYLRIVALHGDFTESQPSPVLSATTTSATLDFDIDIDDITGTSTESAPPYSIAFIDPRKLIQTGPPQTAEDLIWLDSVTNARGGFVILQKGLYGGLYSANETYTIPGGDIDLNGTTEGFGIQNYYAAQIYHTSSGSGDLAEIEIASAYAQSDNVVGDVDTLFKKIYEAQGPVVGGRTGTLIKARASATTPEETDYTEDITFVMIPRY